ncbi:MAG: hypothetical protein KAT30_15020 [Candidatus Krumholzibacteria bacterium]|nr:hypothetical protein [Candidatus Krumholzibacteria bacterium]
MKSMPIWDLVKTRWFAAAICCICVSLPFLRVGFPPILDLAQQTAQIRLFGEAVSDSSSPYRVQWLAPNKLSYLVLGLSWAIAGAAHAARLAMVIIAVSWVASLHWLAGRRRLPAAGVALACVFFFNHFVYLGFLNFTVGVPVFALWFVLTADPAAETARGWRVALSALAGALLLYSAHMMWLAAGTIWFALNSVIQRHPVRTTVVRVLGTAPVIALAAAQYVEMSQGGWGFQIKSNIPVLQRLTGLYLPGHALGGVRGWLEPAVLLVVALWTATALWHNRKRLRSVADKPMLTAAMLFFAFGLLLPSTLGYTLFFASRWIPVACVFFILALPAVRINFVARTALATILLAAFCVTTACIWWKFNQVEMSGFDRAIRRIEPGTSLLGLDFNRESPRMKLPPYFQMFAYAQVFEDVDLNWSFAESRTSLVVFRNEFLGKPWTAALQWFPDRVRSEDFGYFDYVLIHGGADVQERYSRSRGLIPASGSGRWRLFKVERRAND